MSDYVITSGKLAGWTRLAESRLAVDDVEGDLGVREQPELFSNLLGDRNPTLRSDAHELKYYRVQ